MPFIDRHCDEIEKLETSGFESFHGSPVIHLSIGHL